MEETHEQYNCTMEEPWKSIRRHGKITKRLMGETQRVGHERHHRRARV
jgi:hypothetical protein